MLDLGFSFTENFSQKFWTLLPSRIMMLARAALVLLRRTRFRKHPRSGLPPFAVSGPRKTSQMRFDARFFNPRVGVGAIRLDGRIVTFDTPPLVAPIRGARKLLLSIYGKKSRQPNSRVGCQKCRDPRAMFLHELCMYVCVVWDDGSCLGNIALLATVLFFILFF